MIAQNGSGCDSYVVLNKLPQWQSVVNLIKNRSTIVSLKILNEYVDEKKKTPQCVHFNFRCGRVQIISILKTNWC